MRRLSNEQKGQGLLEFALIFLILMMIIMGIIGFGLIFNAQLTMNLAVNAAAREAAVQPYTDGTVSIPDPYDQPIYQAFIDSLMLLTKDNIQEIIIYEPQEDGSIGTKKNILNKNGNLVGGGNYLNEDRMRDSWIGVQVRYIQPVIVPIVSAITGEDVEIVKATIIRIE
jgi:hypothetical protein